MCLATDACLTAIPGVASLISARSHTFVEIDHEIISTVILLPSADSFKKGCCQLQAKVCARITGYPLVQACPGKSVVRWTDRPAMTIAVDLGSKATKQPTNQIIFVRQLAVNQELSAEISQILVIENTTLTTFSMKHLVKRKVYTDVGGIK